MALPAIPPLDRSVPAVVVKAVHYELHHGALGIIRSLGRAKVPVFAILENGATPVAYSRYLSGRLDWWPEPPDDERFVARMVDIARCIGRPSVAIAADDVAAILLAENASRLRPWFVLPGVHPELIRTLSSKIGMHDVCRDHGIPTPRTYRPESYAHLVEIAAHLGYPLIAKNVEPFRSRESLQLPSTVLVQDQRELEARFAHLSDLSTVLIQEYIPLEHSEDWFVALYRGEREGQIVGFTGQKARAWPMRSGSTAEGRSRPNKELWALAERFVNELGWLGIASLDWRLDHRTGRYNLLDFNVRPGAQFSFGESLAGVDVVRAMHLDLTGRPIPPAAQDYRRRLKVGNIYLLNTVGRRFAGLPTPAPPEERQQTVRAWSAWDDPVPALVMATKGTRSVWRELGEGFRLWRQQRAKTPEVWTPTLAPAVAVTTGNSVRVPPPATTGSQH